MYTPQGRNMDERPELPSPGNTKLTGGSHPKETQGTHLKNGAKRLFKVLLTEESLC